MTVKEETVPVYTKLKVQYSLDTQPRNAKDGKLTPLPINPGIDLMNSTELLSLQLKYEQVCQRERKAKDRNSSFKRDIARVRRKVADLSLEMKIKRLQIKKKEYEESAYSTWLAENSFLNPQPCNNGTTSDAIPSFSHATVTPMPSHLPAPATHPDSIIPSFTSSPSLHQTPQIPPQVPLQSMPPIVMASLNSSSQVHFSTGMSPISHPAPFVPPLSVPGVDPSLSLNSQSASITSTMSTTLSTPDQNDFVPNVSGNGAIQSTTNLPSNNLPSHQALSVPLPNFSAVALNDSDDPRDTSLLSPTSSLLSSSHTSPLISPQEIAGAVFSSKEILEQDTVVMPGLLEGTPTQKQEMAEDIEEMSEKEDQETEVENKVIRIDIPRQEEENSHDETDKDSESRELELGRGGDGDQPIIQGTNVDFIVKPKETKESSLVLEESPSDIEQESHSISSISPLPDHSPVGVNQRIQRVPAGTSSEEHMSAYYKLVGKCSDQGKSPALSQSSEESDLEDNLRLAVTKSLDNEGQLDEDDLLMLPDKSPVTVEGLIDLQGNYSSAKNVTEQKPTLPSFATSPEHSAQGSKSKNLVVDNKSYRRRLGLVSSSEDDSDNSAVVGVAAATYKSPREGKSDGIVADIGNGIDDDDDDDFDFYS